MMPLLLRVFTAGGAVRPNYRGEAVPTGLGAGPALAALAAILLAASAGAFPSRVALAVAAAGGTMLWAGTLDDLLGDGSVRGLRGHFAAARQGRWTTGGLKALSGLVAGLSGASLLVPVPWDGPRAWASLAVGAGLIAAVSNSANLFDLRPGRAVKFLVLLWVAILAAGSKADAVLPILALANLAALLAYSPWDLSGRAMMGDAGANALGAMAGAGLVLALPLAGQGAALLLFLALHMLSERVSFTRVIEKVPLLQRIDNWGRGPRPGPGGPGAGGPGTGGPGTSGTGP